jgi:hypothetical protein
MHAGVEEGEAHDALRRQPHHLEGGPRPHGMADHHDRPVAQGERGPGHGDEGIVRRDVRHRDVRVGPQRRHLMREDAGVAQEAGEEDDRRQGGCHGRRGLSAGTGPDAAFRPW